MARTTRREKFRKLDHSASNVTRRKNFQMKAVNGFIWLNETIWEAKDSFSIKYNSFTYSWRSFWDSLTYALTWRSTASRWRLYVDFTQNMGQLPGVSSGKVILIAICCLKVSYGKYLNGLYFRTHFKRVICRQYASVRRGEASALTFRFSTASIGVCQLHVI